MFHCRAGMGDEQAVQLQELNSRLSVYLSRVRQLEQENQLLVQEIESLQVGREDEWKRGYEVEIIQLRTQLEELTVQKSQAEMERENLRLEFQGLKQLCGEVQAIRANIEKEIARHRVDLKKAEDGCRVLEEVLLRLQAEHQELVVICEQEVAYLRSGVLGLTVEWVREEKPCCDTSQSLRAIEEYAIEVSESWKETFQQYQRKVQELEEWVRVSVQDLEGAEEEKRQHLQELGDLRWQVEELERIRLSLEEELRAMREKFMLQVHEYEVVIESLEDEKECLALSISERLKEYHELMQTKTDLSAEVATYRALLEGENYKGMFKWTEEQKMKMQQGFRTSAHEQITNYSLNERENARRFLPTVHTSVDTRHKMLLSQDRSSGPWLRPGPLPTGSATTVRKDVFVTGHRPASSIREEVTYQSNVQNYNGHTLPWHTDNYRPSLPTFTTRESTSNLNTSSTGVPRPGISQVTKQKLENFNQFPGYDRSWEIRETKTTQSEGQGVSTEKKKEHEYSKPLSTNLPKEQTESIKVTKIEKTAAVGEKPSREETGFVFETKDTAAFERGNTGQKGLTAIDVPIKISGTGKVHGKIERENQIQKEIKFMKNTQEKQEDITQKGPRTIEIPIQRHTQEGTTVIEESRGERSFIVNIQDNKYTTVVSESEEQIKGWDTQKDQTSIINQEILTETTIPDELAKPSSQNLSKEKTKIIKVTTVEKTVALGEKPSREETSYVFEMGTKDTAERANTRHDESISIDVPIKVIGKNERNNQNQKEMNFLVNTKMKLGEGGVTQEELGTIEIPIHLVGTRDTQEKTTVIDKAGGERSFVVKEGVKEHSATASEWEVQTREHESQKDHTSTANQEISTQKTKTGELSKTSSQNLPDEETKSVKVTSVEKTIALGEKPTRAETSYVFEIVSKDAKMSEKKHEESLNIDIPIKVVGMESAQEMENNTQQEMNFTVHKQVKRDGEDVAHEGLRTIEIPIQLIGARETQEKIPVIDKTRLERSFIVNKEFKEYLSDFSEGSVLSEEQYKEYDLRKDQRSSVTKEKPSESLNRHEYTRAEFEAHGIQWMPQESSILISLRSTDSTEDSEDSGNVAKIKELYAAETKSSSNTMGDESVKQSSNRAGTWAEEFAEHVKIADILREFSPSTRLEMPDDAKVSYSEIKRRADNGTVTTEITMQSTTEEDFDMSDEEEIEQLLNSSLEKTTLKHLKGMQAENFLENILHGGMKGKTGVRVKIMEEPMEFTTDEQGEFSVPFQVEEADDAASSFQRNHGTNLEGAHCSMAAHGVEDQTKTTEDTTHVEDVTDGGDTGEDLEYIVSTPDDFPFPSSEHDDSLYGHVHFEEESNIRFSWEDEFSKSTQHKKTSSDLPEHGIATETYCEDREGAFNDSVEGKSQETTASHVERLVIEKEIKVPLELQASILGLLSKEIKDPKHQLKGALQQLEESLPGILKDELSALSTEDQQGSNDFAVDVKKVEQTNEDGVVTIVAEINVSKTFDVDNIDVLNNLEANPDIIETAVFHSSKYDASENLKSHKDIDIAGKAVEIQVSTAENSSKLWSSEGIYSSSKTTTNKDLPSSTAEEAPQERSYSDPSKPILTGETTQTSADVNTFVRHIKLDPKEVKTTEHVIFEGPVSETWELGTADKQREGSTDATRSVRHLKVGTTEIRTTQEFLSEGPSSEVAEFGEEAPPSEESADGSRSIRHITLGPREVYSSEQIIFEGPISDPSQIEGPAANNRFIRHIQLGAKEFQTEQHIIFKGATCESPEDSDKGDASKTSSNISTKHLKISPVESQTMEHIIFHGPLVHSEEHACTETRSEGGSSSSIRHFTLGSKTQSAEQIIFKGPISEASAEGSTHVRHIKISPTDLKNSGQIIFQGPISDSLKTELTTSTRHIKIKTRDMEATEEGSLDHQELARPSPSVVQIPHPNDSADGNKPITLIKLGPTEKSFTFQVDVSQSSADPVGEGGSQQTKMIFSTSTLTEDPTTTKPKTTNEDEEKHIKEANSQSASTEIMPDQYEEYYQANGQEVTDTSMFDRTIQLQRMVDQRSLISDDKKIAVVYLEHEEEF